MTFMFLSRNSRNEVTPSFHQWKRRNAVTIYSFVLIAKCFPGKPSSGDIDVLICHPNFTSQTKANTKVFIEIIKVISKSCVDNSRPLKSNLLIFSFARDYIFFKTPSYNFFFFQIDYLKQVVDHLKARAYITDVLSQGALKFMVCQNYNMCTVLVCYHAREQALSQQTYHVLEYVLESLKLYSNNVLQILSIIAQFRAFVC